MNNPLQRQSALITGANGGMGRACAREFGRTMDLVLTDISQAPLQAFADSLQAEGYTIRNVLAGDLNDEALLAELIDSASQGAGLGCLLHTAGLSPTQSDWQTIMRVNLVATARLLAIAEPALMPGTCVLLIASMAGHMVPHIAEIDDILRQPLDAGLIPALSPLMEKYSDPQDPHGLTGLSYGLSKQAVIRLCEYHAASFARRGARIVSISPGTMWTPMGQQENTQNPGAAAVVAATPMGRWGTAMDIAAAARFLASESASFITGCDLRIDGGVTAALKNMQMPQ